MRKWMISQTKPLKIKSFLPFNFAITEICVAIRLPENGARMGEGGANSFNYPLVKIILCENMIPERFYVYQKKIIYKEKCGTTTK